VAPARSSLLQLMWSCRHSSPAEVWSVTAGMPGFGPTTGLKAARGRLGIGLLVLSRMPPWYQLRFGAMRTAGGPEP